MALPTTFPDLSTAQLPLVAFVATILVVLAVFAVSRISVNQRLYVYNYAQRAATSPMDPSVPFSQRVILPLIQQLANIVRSLSREQIEQDVRQKLGEAGTPYNLDVTTFLALRGAGLILPPLLYGLPRILAGTADLKVLAITLVLSGVGWNLPTIWLDSKNARTLRIEMQAVEIPKEFLADTTESAVDYELVSLGTQKFLLPVHAEVLTCMRGTSTCDKNVIEFRNYHKFSGESTIQFAK